MLIDFIFLLILFGLVYSYTSSQNQFAATASAIRQIWSGSCRLSCRHSAHSALSGLSGLPASTAGPSRDCHCDACPCALIDNFLSCRLSCRHSAHSALSGLSGLPASAAGPSRDCHCDACPCALIDNFLSSWRPATTMYSQLVELLSDLITFVLQMLMTTYDYILRVFQCNVECQHPQMIVYKRSNFQRDSNTSFGKGDKENIENVKTSISGKKSEEEIKTHFAKPEKGDVKQQKLLDDGNDNVGTSKAPKEDPVASMPKVVKEEGAVPVKASKTSNSPTIMKVESSSESLARKGYCSKCIEKGRTCIKECPRAKK